jgi:hypothetical protein
MMAPTEFFLVPLGSSSRLDDRLCSGGHDANQDNCVAPRLGAIGLVVPKESKRRPKRRMTRTTLELTLVGVAADGSGSGTLSLSQSQRSR